MSLEAAADTDSGQVEHTWAAIEILGGTVLGLAMEATNMPVLSGAAAGVGGLALILDGAHRRWLV